MKKPNLTTTDYFVYGGIILFVGGMSYFTYSQIKKLKLREKELADAVKKADATMEEFENCCLASGGMDKMKMSLTSIKDYGKKKTDEETNQWNRV